MPTPSESPAKPTACIALADGSVFYGHGFGAAGETVAELVFNTAMTGYQEILTDPSYAGQIITFTYPHIGNYGVNSEDVESNKVHAAGLIIKDLPMKGLFNGIGIADIVMPKEWRAPNDARPAASATKEDGLCVRICCAYGQRTNHYDHCTSTCRNCSLPTSECQLTDHYPALPGSIP